MYVFFFQFCESAPTTLGLCDLEDVRQPSYTSYQYFDKATKEKKLLNDEIYCLCPEGYNYLDTRYVFYQRAEYDVVQINSYCLPVSILHCKYFDYQKYRFYYTANIFTAKTTIFHCVYKSHCSFTVVFTDNPL